MKRRVPLKWSHKMDWRQIYLSLVEEWKFMKIIRRDGEPTSSYYWADWRAFRYKHFSSKSVLHSFPEATSTWLAFLYKQLVVKIRKRVQVCFFSHMTALWLVRKAFHFVFQDWLSSGPTEFFTFSYSTWLWSWLILQVSHSRFLTL